MSTATNPFADERGIPLSGKEDDFFAWAREQELKRRVDLPKEEVEKIEESENALKSRMDS